jgi:nucleoporin GLE1
MAQARLSGSPLAARNSPRTGRNQDSPSRQLQWELERALSQLDLHEIERTKLHAHQKRQERDELDAREAAQATAYRLERDAVSARLEAVRQRAEEILQAHIEKEAEELRQRQEQERRRLEEEQRRLEQEEQRRRAEEEARRQAELQRRIRAEQEVREREERARREAEERARQTAEADEKRRAEKAAAERKLQEEQARAKAAEEAAVKKQQADAQAAAEKAVHPPRPAASQPTTTHVPNVAPEVEGEHKEYLSIHQKLKKFRVDFWTSTRNDPALKPHVGDMRRAMKTSVGQLTDDKATNKIAVSTCVSHETENDCNTDSFRSKNGSNQRFSGRFVSSPRPLCQSMTSYRHI